MVKFIMKKLLKKSVLIRDEEISERVWLELFGVRYIFYAGKYVGWYKP